MARGELSMSTKAPSWEEGDGGQGWEREGELFQTEPRSPE